jgi:hypothetical protein
MYIGTGIEADTESKVGLYEPHKRGVNIAVDAQFLGQTDWKTIPEAKEVVISDKKVSREENLDIWGSLVIEGNTSTQSWGNSTVWDRGQVQVDKVVNLGGVATVLGQMDIGTNISQLSAAPQGAVIHATFSQVIATASTPQIIELNNLTWSRGVTLQSNRIYIQNPGTYKMTVTILVENNNSQPGDVRFWLEFNGSPYPLSGHYFTAPARKSTGVPSETIVNFDFIGTSQNYNDYIELWWQGESTDLSLHFEPQSGGIPAAAAVTVNLSRL